MSNENLCQRATSLSDKSKHRKASLKLTRITTRKETVYVELHQRPAKQFGVNITSPGRNNRVCLIRLDTKFRRKLPDARENGKSKTSLIKICI